MNYFRHFEQLLLPTVVLETYEGRNTLQVSVVVFWLVGLGFFILGPVPPPPLLLPYLGCQWKRHTKRTYTNGW